MYELRHMHMACIWRAFGGFLAVSWCHRPARALAFSIPAVCPPHSLPACVTETCVLRLCCARLLPCLSVSACVCTSYMPAAIPLSRVPCGVLGRSLLYSVQACGIAAAILMPCLRRLWQQVRAGRQHRNSIGGIALCLSERGAAAPWQLSHSAWCH